MTSSDIPTYINDYAIPSDAEPAQPTRAGTTSGATGRQQTWTTFRNQKAPYWGHLSRAPATGVWVLEGIKGRGWRHRIRERGRNPLGTWGSKVEAVSPLVKRWQGNSVGRGQDIQWGGQGNRGGFRNIQSGRYRYYQSTHTHTRTNYPPFPTSERTSREVIMKLLFVIIVLQMSPWYIIEWLPHAYYKYQVEIIR